MRGGERGEGRKPKDRGAKGHGTINCGPEHLEQIEYLLQQSTQGFHFMFDRAELVRVLSKPSERRDFFSEDNMKKVQGLLSRLLELPSMQEKRNFLERLPDQDFELLVRAYFQLVENTILAHSDLRH